MNKTKFLALVTCVAVLTAPIVEAQAKRLGSGGNVGRVAPSPSAKPQAVPAKPAAPAPQAAPQGQQAAAAQPAWFHFNAGLMSAPLGEQAGAAPDASTGASSGLSKAQQRLAASQWLS